MLSGPATLIEPPSKLAVGPATPHALGVKPAARICDCPPLPAPGKGMVSVPDSVWTGPLEPLPWAVTVVPPPEQAATRTSGRTAAGRRFATAGKVRIIGRSPG